MTNHTHNNKNHYDAIVIGVGGMGSATVYELAKRGKKVLGLEQFDIPHAQGSSHGLSRIIRMAYNENPSYVPLLYRAYELWRETQLQAGEQLLHITGGIDASMPERNVFKGALASCQQYHLQHQVYDAKALNKRFPAFVLPADMMAVYQPDAGFLLSERCIVAHVNLAMALGAVIHGREQVLDWEPVGDGVKVNTDKGTYTADKLVITAGAWANQLLAPLQQDLAVPERQVLAWFQPQKPEIFSPGKLPVWILDDATGQESDKMYYGLPLWGIPGFKVGLFNHLEERIDDPSELNTDIHPADEALLRGFTQRHFPDGCGPTLSMRTCMFTNTPDKEFILDQHPDLPQVVFGAGFSGHGFKFASVIGEILTELALDGQTRHDIDFLRLSRFG